MPIKSFKTTLGNGFIELPFDVRQEFGKARPPVKISINRCSYRSTVCVYGGKYLVPVRRDRQEAAGVKPGDMVKVTVAPDAEERTVEPPADLKAALSRNPSAKARWAMLSFTRKKELAEAILEAKKQETRMRRLQKTLDILKATPRRARAGKSEIGIDGNDRITAVIREGRVLVDVRFADQLK